MSGQAYRTERLLNLQDLVWGGGIVPEGGEEGVSEGIEGEREVVGGGGG